MKRAIFVVTVLVFMLAGGAAMAEMDTPDEGGGRSGWILPKEKKFSPWRSAPRGEAKQYARDSKAKPTAKPVGTVTLRKATR